MAMGKGGETALNLAAAGRHKQVVQLLLEKGADIMGNGKYGETALLSAADGGHKAVVKLLLEKGADIMAKCGGRWRTQGSGAAAA